MKIPAIELPAEGLVGSAPKAVLGQALILAFKLTPPLIPLSICAATIRVFDIEWVILHCFKNSGKSVSWYRRRYRDGSEAVALAPCLSAPRIVCVSSI